MAQNLAEMPVHTRYGHNDTHVLVQHNRQITNQQMTPEQARQVIAALQDALDKLEAHQVAIKNGTVQPLGQAASKLP
jgi:hypothetical protein